MPRFSTLLSYLRYFLKAQGSGGIHSPFVFDLYHHHIRRDSKQDEIQKIEGLRKSLLQSEREIDTVDFGAGSDLLPNRRRKIRDIVSSFSKSPRWGRLLFRLSKRFKPATVLELGTSLGISTLYLALANSHARVITLEGDPETATLARENFGKIGARHIEVVSGNFDSTLEEVLRKLESLDLVFFDGNHSLEPTLRYFRQCLQYSHPDSVFIFDDIHWSPGMEKAWTEIQEHPSVTLTLDLFQVGLVFFTQGRPKENFVLRF